jgi:putative lipoic acid-binding regulatory protein
VSEPTGQGGSGNEPALELLQFPTDYPIKVVGRPSAEFRAHIHAIVVRHVPNVETDRITERLSENGNFLSISYAIRAESREQIEGLVKDLTTAEGVLMVL